MEIQHYIEVKCTGCSKFYDALMPPAQVANLGGYYGTCSECAAKITAQYQNCYDDA